MTRPRILLTSRRPEAVECAFLDAFDTDIIDLTRGPDPRAFAAYLADYDYICPSITDRISGSALDGMGHRTKGICNFGAGVDHFDLEKCAARGIAVTNTPDVVTDDTADIAILLAMMCARRASEGERLLRSGQWTGWTPTQMLGTSLSGKTMGLVGMGRIGQATAMRAHYGFGMRILYHAREPKDLPFPANYRALDDLVAEADIVSLHMPGGAATRHLFDGHRIALMKPDAILVNTGRGDLIDELALVAALQASRISAAGLDVYEHEPHVSAELRALDNVVLLPHIGTATLETRVAMGMRVLRNVQALVAGETPPDLLA